MKAPKMPEACEREQIELKEGIAKACQETGRTGQAARIVLKLLQPHMAKEEEFALPALALLPQLVAGKISPPVTPWVMQMTDRLRKEFARMQKEHEAIGVALRDLATAAEREHKPQYVHFAEKLRLHLRNEEQVLYPAAILIGEYLKLRLHEGLEVG
jgi:iron-sulfur cluster repair protein YtfE (RIC family)